MTFAARMQHQIYWGPLRKPVEWSLKTVLAPWAYLASVLYHDSFWFPLFAERQMTQVLGSPWGRLFENWERLTPDASGFPQVGEAPAAVTRDGVARVRPVARHPGDLPHGSTRICQPPAAPAAATGA